jgi:hypothetical protein
MKITVGGVACGLAAVLGFGGVTIAQDAVQWRVEDGGNGHWYRFDQQVLRWTPHRDRAASQGAYLATVTSEAERSFIESILFVQEADIWLGGESNWPAPMSWITGEPFEYAYWCPGGFNPGGGYAVEICGRSNCLGQFCWNIEGEVAEGWPGNKAVYEWSADCNGDGIVDYGQILDGTLIDIDGNGVPDICECLADLNSDAVVNGGDISVLLGFWGQSGKGVLGDINGDGLVDAADLAILLSSWGKCP